LSERPILEGPILESRQLSRSFGGGGLLIRRPPIQAVDAVSLAIYPGETLAIVGESGSGKSTLGRLLLSLLAPSGGDVLFEGRNIAAMTPAERRRLRQNMQIIFQDPFASLNPQMTVGQIVGEPIWLHRLTPPVQRRERVAQLLTLVGLSPAQMGWRPSEFSGGQRQRIGIARALACEPRLILGDEPVSALDVSVQAQIVNLLEELKHRLGLTLVIIAHGLSVVRHISDRVAVMYLGRIVELAPTEALFETPLHPYTQALLAATPVSTPHARRPRVLLQGDVPSPASPPPGCHFHTRCPHARPLCREQVPALVRGEGRSVACHFWREITGAGASPAAHPSEVFQRRLAIFETQQLALRAATE